ncbi:hypothetical protein [Salisediminibacterium halotolerans]|uniref:asparagine synthase (glutamine-hydrolyzing) n=1 Tax=Salisediminibacterium halotolerans TaxID=517425 RepID=A0A1H9WTK9_9BACI|nr:hypothetical protein [Salisediminibacterium haloalkalitolerans]SES37280.1 hypothetical protein SAMN05444126_1483 [Salisediminibacterium haloalkalitolerans]
MSQIFIWKPKRYADHVNKAKFLEALQAQCELIQEGYLYEPGYRYKKIGDTYIGLIYWDQGIVGWQPWVEDNGFGNVWSGVCENLETASVEDIHTILSEKPHKLDELDGSFSVASWNEKTENIYLATGAVQTQSLFYSEGPNGFAAGNRSGILLDLVENDRELDIAQAGLYINWGYLIGDGTLFKQAKRLKSRSLIDFSKPEIKNYESLIETLGTKKTFSNKHDLLENVSQRFLTRVEQQLAFSKAPIVNTTGGRDSRSIAAAAKKSGYNYPLVSFGSENNEDVRIGKQVADLLGVDHSRRNIHHEKSAMNSKEETIKIKSGSHPQKNKILRIQKNEERLKLWAQLHEGLETFKHVQANRYFFHGNAVYPEQNQFFHGLGGELHRGAHYGAAKYAVDYNALTTNLSEKIPEQLLVYNQSIEKLNESLEEITDMARKSNGKVEEWLDIFYWQRRLLHWGQDMMSVRNLSGYTWTPLFDKQITKMSYELEPSYKSSDQFIEDVTHHIAPELKGLPYDREHTYKQQPQKKDSRIKKSAVSLLHKLGASETMPVIKMYRKTKKTLQSSAQSKTSNKDHLEYMVEFWSYFLLDDINNCIWPSLIDEAYIKQLISKDPESQILWNLLTVEIFHQANCTKTLIHT